LQVAGLNQPLQVSKGRLEWKNGLRIASLTDVEGFGATWSGQVAEAAVADDGTAKWNFQLHANHLDAATRSLDGTTRQARPGYNACSPPCSEEARQNPAASELCSA